MAARGARVHIYGDWDGSGVKKAQQDIGAFEKQAQGFSGAFTKSMLGAGAALGGAFAIGNVLGNVVDYLKGAAEAAIQDEKSMVALKTAMDNVGQGFANAGAEKFIREMMLATGVADDDLRPAFQRLVTATGDAAKSQQLLQTAMDVSAATGKDLVTVSTAISKAATGNVGALSRLGVPLDANIIKTKDFGAAVDVLNQKFGGQAAAAADTYGGQLKRVQTAAAEAQETIGYALLGAIDSVSKAFGGTSGATGVITGFGDAAANLVTGVGYMATEIAKLTAAMAGNNDEGTDWGDNLRNYALALGVAAPPIAAIAAAIERITDIGEVLNDQQEAQAAELEGLSALYAGYKANSDRASSSTVAMAEASADLRKRLDEARQSFTALTDAIKRSQSVDDFKKSLADLDETLNKNARTFKGMGDAAKENRDTLRGAFSDAADIAKDWAEKTGASADQAQRYYDKLARKIVKQFVDDGFKREDVMKFLGAEGIWTGPAKDALSAAERAALQRAVPGFKNVGYQAVKGFAAGFEGNAGIVTAAAAAVANQAERAAKAALEIQSPSKVFVEIGRQTVAGFVEGMGSKDAEVREQARKTMTEAVNQIIADTRGQLKQALNDAKAAFRDFKQGVSDAIIGGIDFGAAAPEFDEAGNRVGGTFIEALRKQAAQAVQFATQVKTLISQGLSKEALQQVLAAGVTAGSSIATELIAGGTTTINETNELVASTQAAADKAGQMAATNWYGAGVKSAQETYEGFKANFGKDGPAREALLKVMDNLAASMNRTAKITVVVDEVSGAKVKVDGKRANGGPVWPGGAFIVGERGPELFMPDVSGQILPSASMPSAGGRSTGSSSFVVNVQAGIGTDGYEVGRAVVDAIKKYERVSGPVFAAA